MKIKVEFQIEDNQMQVAFRIKDKGLSAMIIGDALKVDGIWTAIELEAQIEECRYSDDWAAEEARLLTIELPALPQAKMNQEWAEWWS